MADPDISEVHFEGLSGRIYASRRPAGTAETGPPAVDGRLCRYLLIPSLRVFSPRNALALQMAREGNI
ncbi:hypothetical protein [Arthrobacter sp. Soil736]|uniref:hypothetical protein n=1 Tax=Arthrobacter sp. Soil736 TaxID=1736395 RepID=UPI000B073286|nr:hypothetical protein [Arthrobacter sp. Soil736]